MTVEQEYNAARESIILHRDRLANCGQEATAVYLHTLLAVLEMMWGCHKGYMLLHTEDSSPWGIEIHALYKAICK